MSNDSKLALVTGASRGIGKAIACALGAAGHTVVGTATSDAGADKISSYFKEEGINGQGMVVNVSDAESIDSLLSQIKEKFGKTPEILINNAGITRDNLLMRMKDDEWEDILQTNLTSIYRLSKACLRGMSKARWGRIVSVGSVVGTTGNPGQTNYSAAKAAVIGFSKSLAKEIGSRGITVNVVAPGFIDTDMTQALSDEQRNELQQQIALGRLGSPGDIAAAVAFLASDSAAYITGETLHVNGGMNMA
ncbi:3-oxoacyl-ACP reductase FabG [Pleionea mediterranea]|jgi:3-oxoacyl-[acyl-carrier protein] reductase|uniref:3-oxoacyl-[acyl-carrier-protein] reductase n=1 Tax=Pleionea mediterranea TaxID=523701 RepID=A0A316G4E4_9GAMM|nr:3-oxoacyl-ACP reductase FabG [Pleionea mediterranea]PWK49277.1 3-oxoacyl-[acyl-carrier-protein] reductase [Pleionea mediterranea]